MLTNTLADRDQLIGQVIDNLNIVLGSLADQNKQFDKAVTSISELVAGLEGRKQDISNAVAYGNEAAGSIADLLIRRARRCRRWCTRPTGPQALSSLITSTWTIS